MESYGVLLCVPHSTRRGVGSRARPATGCRVFRTLSCARTLVQQVASRRSRLPAYAIRAQRDAHDDIVSPPRFRGTSPSFWGVSNVQRAQAGKSWRFRGAVWRGVRRKKSKKNTITGDLVSNLVWFGGEDVPHGHAGGPTPIRELLRKLISSRPPCSVADSALPCRWPRAAATRYTTNASW